MKIWPGCKGDKMDEKTYMQTYEDFWKELVETDDKLDLHKVARELSDYFMVLDNVSEVYCNVTGDRVSKPNTLAGAVIAEADDYETKTHYELMVDELEKIKDEACALVTDKQDMKKVERYFQNCIEDTKRYAFV